MFKGVLLDLDHTLYDYDKAHSEALRACRNLSTLEYGMQPDMFEKNYKTAKETINKRLAGTASSHNRLLYFQLMFENVHKWTPEAPLKFYETYWNTFLDAISLDEDTILFLKSLKVPVCIVTDLTSHIQYRKLKKLELNLYIQHLVTSEEAGAEKPSPLIFNLALSKMNLEPSDVCMIGDNFKKDVLGSLSLGITPIWLNRSNERIDLPEKVIEIKKLSELIGKI